MIGDMIYLPENRDNSPGWIRVEEPWEEADGFYCVTVFYPDGEVGGDVLSEDYLIELQQKT